MSCLISGNKNEQIWTKFKLLWISLDNNLKFDKSVSNIKGNRKLSALTRVAKFLPFKKKRIRFKPLFESQFKCCPLAWMFHGIQINEINKLHERSLSIVYNDTITSLKNFGLR